MGLRYSSDGTLVVSSVSGFAYRFDGDKDVVSAMRAQLNQKVAAVVDSIYPTLSKAGQAAYMHDYLVRYCNYDKNAVSGGEESVESHNAYGALVEGNAVCQGYGYAYKPILTQLGVSCVCVRSDEMNHLWNMVRIGENCYHVDVTWDDLIYRDQYGNTYFGGPDDPVSRKYLLISDETVAKYGHSGWESEYTAPYDYSFDDEAVDTHSLTFVDEAPASCERSGVRAYWECSECGRLFLDGEGENEVSASDLVIPALGHDGDAWTVTHLTPMTA